MSWITDAERRLRHLGSNDIIGEDNSTLRVHIEQLRNENEKLWRAIQQLQGKQNYTLEKLHEAVETIHTLWNMPCMPGGLEAIERAKKSYNEKNL